MTCREKLAMEHPEKIDPTCEGGCVGCPGDYGYLKDPSYCCISYCANCWNREIPEEKTNVLTPKAVEKACEALGYKHSEDDLHIGNVIHTNEEHGGLTFAVEPHIKDSGDRREFDSGAVRDMAEGKGRCDLMPLDVVGRILANPTLCYINNFMINEETADLINALTSSGVYHDLYTLFLEVAKHFEEGCKKYGENNWRKGIPVKFYIDSAVRHYLKYLRGDKDEPHDRAFCWNILCAIWTHDHKPELRINPEERTDPTKYHINEPTAEPNHN